ncbi:MAG TPA: hypothetical protein VIR58_18950 [Acidimicrobiales bacterium]
MTALVLAACGDDEEPTADPTTTEAETTTTEEATTTTEPELSEEEAVVKAYVEHWPAFYAFLNGTPPGDPADYFTGDRLADLPGSIAQFAEQGLEVRGEPQLKPGQVQVDGDTATLVDCQLDSASAVSRTTGAVVMPPSALPQAVDVTMAKEDGKWKVASVVFGPEGSCVQ